MTQSNRSQNTGDSGEVPLMGYVSLALAWLVPGLGHLLQGERKRGIIFAVAIHGLFAAGMLLGGTRAINPPDQPIWSYTQFLAGWPMIVTNRVERAQTARLERVTKNYLDDRQPVANDSKLEQRKADGAALLQQNPALIYTPKVQDVGAVYCGIAGMLNLLVVFDVLLRVTKTKRQNQEEESEAAAQTGGGAA